MAVTYSATARTDRMTAVRDLLNGGKFELLEGATIIATFTLNATSGSVAGDALTFSLVSNSVNATNPTSVAVDGARFRTSVDADVITALTVGTSGTEVVLDTLAVVTNQLITVSAISVTHGT